MELSQYISNMTTDGTIGYTVVMFSAAFMLFIITIGIFLPMCLNQKKKADLNLWYTTKLVGYKVGIIEKAAKEEDVQIVEMKSLSVAEIAKEDLEEDLAKV